MSTVARSQRVALDINVVQQPATAAEPHHKKHGHQIVVFVVALGALILLLRTQAKTLQHDWSPVGIGVKLLLVGCVIGLMYYPYELFIKGPDAVEKAMRMPK